MPYPATGWKTPIQVYYRYLNNSFQAKVKESHLTTPRSIQNPVVYTLYLKPKRPPGLPLVMRYPYSQTLNISQVRFTTERFSPLNRPINQPTTSTKSKYINTVPRLSAHVSTTPA